MRLEIFMQRFGLFKYFNGHIRADPPAHRATRAILRSVKDDKVVAFLVEGVGEYDQLLRASGNAQLTTLTPFPIDDNLPHYRFFPVSQILCGGQIPPTPLYQRGAGGIFMVHG
jgi:hypothetical protein